MSPAAIFAGCILVAVGAFIAGLGPRRLLLDLEAPSEVAERSATVALLMGLGVFALGIAWGSPEIGCALGLLAAVLAAVFVVDARTMTIPNLHVLMIVALALLGAISSDADTFVYGGLVGGGLLWAVRWGYRRLRGEDGLGLGDVKLMAALGTLAGPQSILWICVIGALLGAAWGALQGRSWQARIPFGSAAALPGFLLIGWDRLNL